MVKREKFSYRRRQFNVALSADVEARLRALATEYEVTIAEAARVAISEGMKDVPANLRRRRRAAILSGG